MTESVEIRLDGTHARRADYDALQRRGGRKRIVAHDGSKLRPRRSRSQMAR